MNNAALIEVFCVAAIVSVVAVLIEAVTNSVRRAAAGLASSLIGLGLLGLGVRSSRRAHYSAASTMAYSNDTKCRPIGVIGFLTAVTVSIGIEVFSAFPCRAQTLEFFKDGEILKFIVITSTFV